MTVAIVVVVIVALVAVVLAVALMAPQRPASGGQAQHAVDGEGDVDDETHAYRDHPPGGGTGSL